VWRGRPHVSQPKPPHNRRPLPRSTKCHLKLHTCEFQRKGEAAETLGIIPDTGVFSEYKGTIAHCHLTPSCTMGLPKLNIPYFDVEVDTSLPSIQLMIVTALLLLIPAIYYVATYDPRRAKMPPYVKGWPIINQTLDHLSPNIPQLQRKWHRHYGDIFCTKSGATTFIWLSSPQIVKDLIDRRSAIYSSRPPLPLTSDVLSGGRRVAFMPRNNMWRYASFGKVR
jgi:hypothetical protein